MSRKILTPIFSVKIKKLKAYEHGYVVFKSCDTHTMAGRLARRI